MSRDADPDVELRRARRQRLLDALGDGLLVLPSAPETLRNGDVHHEYRPGSDFHHLTGFPEPEAVLAAWRTGKGTHRAVLFLRPRDPSREVWDGKRYGAKGARRKFGVDAAHSIHELTKELPALLAGQRRVFFRLGSDQRLEKTLRDTFAAEAMRHRRRQPPAHPAIEDPTPALAAMRQRKDREELSLLRRAAAITAAGHAAAMAAATPGMREYEVQAELERAFRAAGSPRNGYSSIVASGPNACVLHYHENDRRLAAGDLLLIDAGAEVGGYTADVTRTFPVSGKFSDAQRAVYEVVLRAQLAGIRAVRPGAPWDAPHKVCVRELTRGLKALGVLRGGVAKLVKKAKFRPWYMHGTSHWLGRDVHDAGAYLDEAGKPVRLAPGMVLTIEPGLYFAPRDRRVPAALRGIGVRIEDDVLVTARGAEVLTAAAPKTVRDVEAACARREPAAIAVPLSRAAARAGSSGRRSARAR